MSEIEDKITALKAEIKADEQKIEKIKSEMWQKKKDLKSLEEAANIISGVEKNENEEDKLTESLTKTIIS